MMHIFLRKRTGSARLCFGVSGIQLIEGRIIVTWGPMAVDGWAIWKKLAQVNLDHETPPIFLLQKNPAKKKNKNFETSKS